MNTDERIAILEEIMDLNPGTLSIEDVLSDYEEWDSLSVLTYISTLEERFGKRVTGSQVRALVSVKDAVAFME